MPAQLPLFEDPPRPAAPRRRGRSRAPHELRCTASNSAFAGRRPVRGWPAAMELAERTLDQWAPGDGARVELLRVRRGEALEALRAWRREGAEWRPEPPAR